MLVGLSLEQPVETLESIATLTLNLLEVIRFLGRPIRLYNAGSSECFGDTGGQPVFVCNLDKAQQRLGWQTAITVEDGVGQLIDWVCDHRQLFDWR